MDRYDMLASAIAGRRVTVLCAEPRAPFASCDARSIRLSARALGDGVEARLEIISQALLLATDSLVPRVIRRLVGRPEAARRYAYLEVRRALALLPSRVPHFFVQRPELAVPWPKGALTRSSDESVEYALGAHRTVLIVPDFIGTVRPFAALRDQLTWSGRSARSAQSREFEAAESGEPEGADADETPTSKLLQLFQNPLLGRTPIAKLLGSILGIRTTRSGQDDDSSGTGAHAETPVARIERAWRRGVNAVRALLPVPIPETDRPVAAHAANYPEWDGIGGRYRQDWVQVHEVEPWRSDGPSELAHVLTPAPRELQRRLATLGLNHEMRRRQLEGTEFDLGRLVDCAIDFKTGYSPKVTDIYRASRKTRRDLGVVIVIDVSNSTEEKSDRGESVFEHHLRAAWHLARTFDRLGDRVALFGFQSWGRKLVHMVRLKGHEENWSARIARRFALTEPLGYTRTGAAVRHADHVLRHVMRVPDRLLILITDGLSYDQEYEQKYAEADAAKALAEARQNGTACVCLCVGGGMGAAQLIEVFGGANLLMVDDSRQIPARIRAVCAAALDSVSRRKLGRAAAAQRRAV